ncbi:MAG: sugar nucleotide-binding protein, partial [Pseudobdellovibrionaceae bacterium]
QFALNIVEEARKAGVVLKVKNIKSIPTEAYPTPAKRPKNSRLGTLR